MLGPSRIPSTYPHLAWLHQVVSATHMYRYLILLMHHRPDRVGYFRNNTVLGYDEQGYLASQSRVTKKYLLLIPVRHRRLKVGVLARICARDNEPRMGRTQMFGFIIPSTRGSEVATGTSVRSRWSQHVSQRGQLILVCEDPIARLDKTWAEPPFPAG